ncbi:MAG: hypothetical protein R3A80_00610 [Bdellovibrionota bacterium]
MKKYLVFGFLIFSNAHAFLPDLGHMIRHQPMMLKANPRDFTVEGNIEIQGDKAPFKLSWVGVKEGYVVEFKKIPSSWTTSNISDLTLFRDGAACMLIINKTANPCSSLRFWGDFEFNSNGDRAAQTISAVGIASSSETAYKPINSKEIAESKKPSKVKAVLKEIQGTFLSVLEYANGKGAFIDFDSVNYSPLWARFSVDGMFWDFVASPELYLEKEERKNNLVISQRIEVREGARLVAIVKREPLKRAARLSLPKMPSSKATVSEVPYDRFSDRGREFLKVLFLTH